MGTLKSDIDTKEVSCAAFERRADLLAERLSEDLTGFLSLESWVRHVRERLAAPGRRKNNLRPLRER